MLDHERAKKVDVSHAISMLIENSQITNSCHFSMTITRNYLIYWDTGDGIEDLDHFYSVENNDLRNAILSLNAPCQMHVSRHKNAHESSSYAFAQQSIYRIIDWMKKNGICDYKECDDSLTGLYFRDLKTTQSILNGSIRKEIASSSAADTHETHPNLFFQGILDNTIPSYNLIIFKYDKMSPEFKAEITHAIEANRDIHSALKIFYNISSDSPSSHIE